MFQLRKTFLNIKVCFSAPILYQIFHSINIFVDDKLIFDVHKR